MNDVKTVDILNMIEELRNINRYTKHLKTPDEFFRHMQGHRTELSLVLSAFAISELSNDIIKILNEKLERREYGKV